ncbi:MAG: hypothetical protein PHD95_00595 [Candidatus ainarchaeum sp.]|nr:hypothetical protein [Candidatus ainarchaeum sp.]
MGIYDNKKKQGIKFGFSFKQFKYPAIFVGGLIVIIIVFLALQALLEPQPIIVSINPNPIDLAQEETALLTVNAVNTTQQNSASSSLKVVPVASEMFVVTPALQEISTFEAGARREFVFQIRPLNKANPNSIVPPGDYKIKILLAINGQEFSKEIVLQIKGAS